MAKIVNAGGLHFGTGRGPRLGDPDTEQMVAGAAKGVAALAKLAAEEAAKNGDGYSGDGDIHNHWH